jgi:hypothetical protein
MTAPQEPAHRAERASQLALSEKLARAFERYERAAREADIARAELDLAFFPWAAGRSTNRDGAREQLIAVGFIENSHD